MVAPDVATISHSAQFRCRARISGNHSFLSISPFILSPPFHDFLGQSYSDNLYHTFHLSWFTRFYYARRCYTFDHSSNIHGSVRRHCFDRQFSLAIRQNNSRVTRNFDIVYFFLPGNSVRIVFLFKLNFEITIEISNCITNMLPMYFCFTFTRLLQFLILQKLRTVVIL